MYVFVYSLCSFRPETVSCFTKKLNCYHILKNIFFSLNISDGKTKSFKFSYSIMRICFICLPEVMVNQLSLDFGQKASNLQSSTLDTEGC